MAIDLMKTMCKHSDMNPELINIDLHMDASCKEHLLRPDILRKSRVINNIIDTICNNQILQILPKCTIRYSYSSGVKTLAMKYNEIK